MEKEQSIKEFSCKSAAFYFIYSFMFSKIDLVKCTEIIKEALKYGGYSPKFPSDKGNFEPYLKMSEEFIEFDFFQGEAQIVGKDGEQKNVVIEKNIIFYQTGTGIYTIKVFIRRSLKIEELIEYSLTGDDETYKIKFVETQEEGSMFQLFRKDIKLISERWNLLEERKKDDFIWFERREKLVNPEEHYQNPFVYIELELPEEIYEKAFLTCTGYQREIAAILFRLKVKEDWMYIDESYLRKYEDTVDSKLANMHLYSKIFVSFHTRSCISACVDRNGQPATYFLPALLDTVQLLRCRWHSYVIYNRYLDDKIRGLNEAFAAGKIDVTQFLDDIISIRENLSSSLEDPITWKRASGSLAGIYEEGIKKFRIDELEKLMIRKMEMLDRLFENVKERRLRGRIKSLERKEKKLINKLILFISPFLVGIGAWFLIMKKETWSLPGILAIVAGIALFVYFLSKREKLEEDKFKDMKRNV